MSDPGAPACPERGKLGAHVRKVAAKVDRWSETGLMPVAEYEAKVARLRDICERAVDALRYEAHPVCDEWDELNEEESP